MHNSVWNLLEVFDVTYVHTMLSQQKYVSNYYDVICKWKLRYIIYVFLLNIEDHDFLYKTTFHVLQLI